MLLLLSLLFISIFCGATNCNLLLELMTPADIELIRECPRGFFVLLNDIDIQNPFTPLPPFYGIIMGESHKISVRSFQNLGTNVGLFTEIHGTLREIDFDITLDKGTNDMLNVGLLTGILNSTKLHKVSVNGSLLLTKPINSNDNVLTIGGLAGRSYITPSDVAVNVTIIYSGVRKVVMGGVIGNITGPGLNIDSSIISGLSFNGSIECNDSVCILGGIAGECGRSLLNCSVNVTEIHVWGDWLSPCIYGGLVGIQRASVGSSTVTANVVELTNIDKYSFIGGFVGRLQSECIHCVVIDKCVAKYQDFSAGIDALYVGGFAGQLTGVLIRHSAINITQATFSGTVGGFVSMVSVTNMEQCAVIIERLTQRYTKGSISAGFAAIVDLDVNITDSYARISYYTLDTPLFIFGGFAGTAVDSMIVNCFAWFKIIKIQVSPSSDIKVGGFCGQLYSWNGDSLIENSFVFASSFIYNFRTRHELTFGSFVGEVNYLSGAVAVNTHYLKSLWWHTNVTVICDTWNNTATIRYGGFAAVVNDNTVISDCAGTVNFTGSCLGFKDGHGLASFAYFAQMNGLSALRVLLNTTFTYTQVGYGSYNVKAFGSELNASHCLGCESILIAANHGIDETDLFSIVSEFLTLPATYLARGWWLNGESGWSFLSTPLPVLVTLPYAFVTSGGIIEILLVSCSTPLCWDYNTTWVLSYATSMIDLQFLMNKCQVDLCATCLNSSKNRCIACSSGALDNSYSVCTPCKSGCMSCPTLSSVCEVCSDPSYVATNSGLCIKFYSCPAIEQCTHCYSTANGTLLCIRCKSGYWLNSAFNRCDACPSNCFECSSPTLCTRCKSIRNPPISGYCDYKTLCIDNTNCRLCQASDPFYCVSCNKQNMRPNSDGVCVVSNQTYCTITNCVVCETGNSNRCSVCGLNTYLSFFEGTCLPCPSGCKICTPVMCTSCIDTQKQPIMGTCLYSTMCADPYCLYCLIDAPEQCLLCYEGYSRTSTGNACTKNKTRSNTVPISVGVSVGSAALIVSIIVTVIVCVKKRRAAPNTEEDNILITTQEDTDTSMSLIHIPNNASHTVTFASTKQPS